MQRTAVVRALVLGTTIALSSATTQAVAAIADHVWPQDSTHVVIMQSPVQKAIRHAFHENTAHLNFRQKRDRAAAELFYERRGFQAAWIRNGELTQDAREIIAFLHRADEDGLDPANYPTPLETFNQDRLATAEQIARADFTLTQSVLTYAEDAQSGRVVPGNISKSISVEPSRPDPVMALENIHRTTLTAQVMAAFNPPHAGYQALKQQLKLLRAQQHEEREVVVVPEGKLLKLGSTGKRVSLLRQRLEVSALLPEDEERFTSELKEAVKTFQRENGLNDDGVVGPRTLLAINATVSGNPIHDVIANMERWRWLPRDLGETHLMVNIPEFMVRLQRDQHTLHETRVVVGKKKHMTPIFSDVMNHVIVNPYWNVPYSIASKEILPELRRNPQAYLMRGNYEILSRGKVVDPSRVNWDGVTFKQLRIRQRPGTGNALGDIKFMFPNRHNVYLHDTPSKSLFRRSARAFSHGCVRVQNPFEFADALMAQQPSLTGHKIRSMLGGKQKQVNLEKTIPIHITYFTAFVDENGNLQRRPDVYGHNDKTIEALGLSQ
ncbi:L,D-transpeptidase family protein [Pseudovibrio exalbescens]|uniref:L,D-transpeptidase family protein n=1 Tax=Pseudovibrio exalbescens TaxID=197461 RepID=UPI00236675F3|nr:L,D-transpeptidase family protein [Pseudovibrio exalbescens]MDD7911860.1 L,D-transpeptidase family protein [Pseudovibrio exalbescens]